MTHPERRLFDEKKFWDLVSNYECDMGDDEIAHDDTLEDFVQSACARNCREGAVEELDRVRNYVELIGRGGLILDFIEARRAEIKKIEEVR